MKVYEGLFIFSVETAAADNVAAEVTGWIQRFEGVVDQIVDVGTRRLGFKIKKVADGRVFAVTYQMNPNQAEAFRKALEMEGKLLSFTLTFPPSKKAVPKFFKADDMGFAGVGDGREGYGRY